MGLLKTRELFLLKFNITMNDDVESDFWVIILHLLNIIERG